VFSAAPTEVICRGVWKHQQPLQLLFVGAVQSRTAPTVHFLVKKIIKNSNLSTAYIHPQFIHIYIHRIYNSNSDLNHHIYTYIHPQVQITSHNSQVYHYIVQSTSSKSQVHQIVIIGLELAFQAHEGVDM